MHGMKQIDYAQGLRLDGRGYVVLGTGGGIGGEVCKALSQVGARVLCVDLSLESAQKTASAVEGVAMSADIASRVDMEAVFKRAEELFGEDFHGVVDVVGVPLITSLEDATDDVFDKQYDLVVRHAWLTISIAAPKLARYGRGSIVLVSSVGAFRYHPNVALYCSAKGALNSLASNAAIELAPTGVRINVVMPGRIAASGITRPTGEELKRIEAGIPMRRAGRPPEVASTILFLMSDMASYVTGALLAVDGGALNAGAP